MQDGMTGQSVASGISGIEEASAGDKLYTSTNRIYWRDAALNIYSSVDGQLDITADTTVALSGAVTSDSTVAMSATTTNHVLAIAQAGTGKGATISVADGSTTSGLEIDHNETNGAAVGMKIDVASTGATAFAFHITGSATNTGIIQTAVQTDAAIDTMAAAIRITNGTTTYYIPCLTTFTN